MTSLRGVSVANREIEARTSFDRASLYWMAVGTFAIGTEGFMIAAVLPAISADLSVTVQKAGQLVVIFALTYAISSPVLTALTGYVDRRKLLLFSMAAFAAANLVGATASNYSSLATARVLLAMAAGLYVPSANALAGALVPPGSRGRALAVVNGGLTFAVALGVPLGAFVGTQFGWRMNFVGVACLGTLAFFGLLFGLPRGIDGGLSVATLRERLSVVRRPVVLVSLLVTTLWAVGAYTVYTYIVPFLGIVAGLKGRQTSYALFLWGSAAFAGLALGGAANDKIGGRRVITLALPLLALALGSLSATPRLFPPEKVLLPVLVAIVVWGASSWGFYPAQQARLIDLTGLKSATVALSLNASFMYLGFSLGAALGSLVLTMGSTADLGWAGGLCEIAALSLFLSPLAANVSRQKVSG